MKIEEKTTKHLDKNLRRGGDPYRKANTASSNGKKSDEITLDGRASENVVNKMKYFRTPHELRKMELCLASGTVVRASQRGKIEVELQRVTSVMSHVLYVPTVQSMFMSCSRLNENKQGITTMIANLKGIIIDKHNKEKVLGTL